MSSTAGTRPVPQPPGGPAQPSAPGQGATLGLLSATGLVISTIVGVGVFTMPAVLASAGTCSLVVLAVVNFAAGYQAVYQTLVAMFAGIVLSVFVTARREDVGQIPQPVDNPPDDSTGPGLPT